MQVQTIVKRRTIPIAFSQAFEAVLLERDTAHVSLTHDLEEAALAGQKILHELEDVHDLKHIDYISKLVEKTNSYAQISSPYFSHWYLSISEDLLDELELLILVHGDDLLRLGLRNIDVGTVLVFAAVAGLKESGNPV